MLKAMRPHGRAARVKALSSPPMACCIAMTSVGGCSFGESRSPKFDIVSEFRITKGVGPHWAHPVIVNGVLYIRHGFALMAYKVK